MKLIQAVLLYFLSVHIVQATDNAIFYAVQQNDTKALENILKQNSTNIQLNQDGQTILHVAVLANNWKAVKTIIQSGFTNINQLDKNGKTAMDYATEHGYNKMIRKLYKNKGKVTSIENATNAKKAITRPFKILLGIGIALLTVSMIFVGLHAHAMNPAISFGPHGRGAALTVSSLLAKLFGTISGTLLLPAISGWSIRSHKNLYIK